MPKVNWNPLDPNGSHRCYELSVGDEIERQMRQDPGFLRSLFRHSIDDRAILESLTGPEMRRVTTERPTWKGASGYDHQIDESFTADNDAVIVLVECKRWSECLDILAVSTCLVRVMDVADALRGSTVLGMIVTTQGVQGRVGRVEEHCDASAKLIAYFCRKGYPVTVQWLPDMGQPYSGTVRPGRSQCVDDGA